MLRKPKHDSKLFSIVDYQLYRLVRVGGGVCVYAHNTLASNMYHFTRVRNVNPLFELMWIRVCASDEPDFVLGECYYPPKPKYKTNDLLTTILSDIDATSIQSPDAVIALTGDFNSLNTDSFVNECGLVMLKDSATHGKRFLDKFFISRSGLYLWRTLASRIKTKHKALLITDSTSCKFSYKQPNPKVYRRRFDLREP
jgi:hypothetical protein